MLLTEIQEFIDEVHPRYKALEALDVMGYASYWGLIGFERAVFLASKRNPSIPGILEEALEYVLRQDYSVIDQMTYCKTRNREYVMGNIDRIRQIIEQASCMAHVCSHRTDAHKITKDSDIQDALDAIFRQQHPWYRGQDS